MRELNPTIIFEDAHVLIVDKPAGLLSQGEHTGDPNLVDWARTHVGRNYVGLIHRLDRNTSGIMILAKRTKAAQRLTAALQSGKLERTYLAWVEGSLTQPVRWRHFLRKDEKTNTVRVVKEPALPASTSKEAILTATPRSHCLRAGKNLTLVEYVLETGRSHQIRVQSAAEGFPIAGDRKYGKMAPSSGTSLFTRPLLHSARLRFPHPMSQEVLTFEAALPQDMRI